MLKKNTSSFLIVYILMWGVEIKTWTVQFNFSDIEHVGHLKIYTTTFCKNIWMDIQKYWIKIGNCSRYANLQNVWNIVW